jgi:hypothetical protein
VPRARPGRSAGTCLGVGELVAQSACNPKTPMRPAVLLFSGFLCGFSAIPAAAASPCGDGIRAFEVQVDDAASKSISVSSAGKAVAASREGQGEQQEGRPAEAAAPKPSSSGLDAKTAQSAQLGGGDNVMQARATLNRARELDREGNAEACQEALAEAQRQLGPAQ